MHSYQTLLFFGSMHMILAVPENCKCVCIPFFVLQPADGCTLSGVFVVLDVRRRALLTRIDNADLKKMYEPLSRGKVEVKMQASMNPFAASCWCMVAGTCLLRAGC